MQEEIKQPKFFGRRKGRVIRKTKSTLLEQFLPKIKIDENTCFDRKTMFGKEVEKINLEIGFGDGVHLAGQALNNPTIGFIGIEVFKNGVANLLTLITGVKQGADLPQNIEILDNREDNIRVFDDDARLLFSKIPDGFVDRVFLLFPDPWPKKRHAKRRLTYVSFLEKYKTIIKDGGKIFFKTDNRPLFDFSLEQFELAHIPLSDVTFDLHNSEYEKDNVHTEYEDNFSAKGFSINRLVGTIDKSFVKEESAEETSTEVKSAEEQDIS